MCGRGAIGARGCAVCTGPAGGVLHQLCYGHKPKSAWVCLPCVDLCILAWRREMGFVDCGCLVRALLLSSFDASVRGGFLLPLGGVRDAGVGCCMLCELCVVVRRLLWLASCCAPCLCCSSISHRKSRRGVWSIERPFIRGACVLSFIIGVSWYARVFHPLPFHPHTSCASPGPPFTNGGMEHEHERSADPPQHSLNKRFHAVGAA